MNQFVARASVCARGVSVTRDYASFIPRSAFRHMENATASALRERRALNRALPNASGTSFITRNACSQQRFIDVSRVRVAAHERQHRAAKSSRIFTARLRIALTRMFV
ncbi:MAG TPA: hypothetical protein VFQ35_26105 [Polyangiaceae bacterium]|nr:hypothetical protein [Polyangiaceae bacterium]